MALQEVIDSLEGLPEQFHEDYEQVGEGEHKGKFQLKLVKGLKANQAAVLAEKKRLADQIKAYEGIDPERAREALKKLQDLDEEQARKAGDFESLKKSLQDGYEAKEKGYKSDIEFRDRAISNYLIEAEANAAIGALEGKPLLLLPHIKAQTRVVKTDDGFRAEVIDLKTNQTRYNSKGEPMSVKELVEEMHNSEDFAPAFKAKGVGGSGAQPSGQLKKGQPDYSSLHPTERMKLARRK